MAICDTVTNEEYDYLMSSSVVFLDLYDSSANNVVIECVASNTPILINKIDAVVEYLGEDYPLYFNDLNHAVQLLSNTNNIIKAHTYLKQMDKRWLSGHLFARSLVKSLSRIVSK